MAKFDPSLYTVKFIHREMPRPWSWAILKSGLKNPIQRSTRSFATEEAAREDGETALGTLFEALQSRRASARPQPRKSSR